MSRISKVQSGLIPKVVFLVSNPTNIRYLINFSGSNGLLAITSDRAVLFTDTRYEVAAKHEIESADFAKAAGIELEISSNLLNSAMHCFPNEDFHVEGNHMVLHQWKTLVSAIGEQKVKVSEIAIEVNREIKDQSEIAIIQQACEIAVTSLGQFVENKILGRTERELAVVLERLMIDNGADGLAFPTILASGANSAIPHHQPTDKPVEAGDLIKIDFGAAVQGYKSDCTRTFVVGKAQEWQQELHSAVVQAQANGRKAVLPGTSTGEVDRVVRSHLEIKNFADYFTHGLGHGVGLDIHEDPFLGRVSTDKIAKNLGENMVITVEPGVYLPDRGGVRIEDTGLVTASGYEVFTKFTYDLLEIK